MKYFVDKNSIVRHIWGKADTVLFIFAGAAAEFAVNKAVDWLYFTGRLPADPLGRLFSTVTYARQIIFSSNDDALAAIDKITAIHQSVEKTRGAQIPAWAYRDVLFMLIDYSVRSYELLERPLTAAEKQEVFRVFNKVGQRMGLEGLPESYRQWQIMRNQHLHADLIKSKFTTDLYRQYKKHLGLIRYLLVKQVQLLVCPPLVTRLIGINGMRWLAPIIAIYKFFRLIKLDKPLKGALLPAQYKVQIQGLDVSS
ncbi:oxygenase MpaB family protein [Mucilaginibacter segetis]|uniref:DUF2236 domain-containing protein n=1 Tax=Mucilaginibacter segetis TaxID=2793071 RepID=A0A934UNS3_9SPHI|nr:oxygenase MpaB family protein [Mucilaginibacter segetis]MBK0380709.1 DUF2236 domain-containing protein [Mucilaginibacter segetis]